MKGRISKLAATLALGLTLSFGTAMAQNYPTPPTSECQVNGQMGTVDLRNGVRYFMCWEGQWNFMYECTYDPLSGVCVIH